MTLSDLSIKNPVFAWMLMAALMLFGWIGFRSLGISQLPDVDFPIVNVQATWEGASPEVMETEVTDAIEDAVMQVQGIRELSSSSKKGSASITIEFDLDRDIDAALQEVQTKVAQAQRNLPKDMDPVVVNKTNPEDNPIMWLGLSGDRERQFLMEYARNQLKDEFTTLPGVGEVILGGYVDSNLRVWLDRHKMQEREITAEDVINTIGSQHAEVPAGFIDTGKRELNVRVMGEAEGVDEFKSLVIPGRGGAAMWRTIKLGEVADVEDGLADIRRLSRVNGKPALGLGIKKQRGANAVAVAREVRRKMDELNKGLPAGLELGVNFDSTRYIEISSRELTFHLVLAAVLTSVVCWMFLGSFSSALNVILAIPTSILGTFIALYFFGFTLNTFTLLGLTLVIGIVVDDAIMVLENIVRYHEMGNTKVKASILGAREITSAAVAATVAILAIFVPVVFMQGVIGKFFFQFGITISVAVMLSLLEALTLAPMRTSQFLETGHGTWMGRRMDAMMADLSRRYANSLAWCLAHNRAVVISAVVIFLLSITLARVIKKEFVPPQDQGTLLIRLQTPVGTAMAVTDDVFQRAEALIAGHGEVRRYYSAIGGFGGGDVNSGVVFVSLKDKKDRPVDPQQGRPLTQQELMPVLRKELSAIPGVQRAVIQDLSLSGFTSQRGFPVEFTLIGRDWAKLAELSALFEKKMAETGSMADVDSDYQEGQPEVRVVPDRAKAAQRGVSVATIGNTINAMIGGVRVGKYSKGGRRYDIRVRLVEGDRQSPADISNIWVRNNRGELIRLSEVVKIEERSTLLSVTRKNRERAIRLFANVAPGRSQGEALADVQRLAREILPEGYRIELSGSAETFKQSFNALFIALGLGVVVAYMVLASQYNSFIHPITVLMALPFSVTGAFLALWIGGRSINLYSMIGVILLMGIVKKNSILLVDFTNERRSSGLGVREALLEACPIRLRPIIMTSVSTIAAAIPSALSRGAGSETTVPMALVIIGGVALSTLLTLFVVPSVYMILSRFESHRHDRNLKEALRELGEAPGHPGG